MPPPDQRRVVGGTCWAKAEAVSKNCKRIYGAALDSTWLEGKVIKVESRRKTPTGKPVTYVCATFTVGREEKDAWFPLQSLKKMHPANEKESTNHPSVEQQQPANNGTVPATGMALPPLVTAAPTAAAAPATVTPTNGPPVGRVAVVNDREWYDGVVDVDFNGPVPVKAWKMTCLLYTSPSPRDQRGSRMPSSA